MSKMKRRDTVAGKVIDAMERAERRGRRVVHIAMHPNAYRAWHATEVPAGDCDSLEWAGVYFTKDRRLRDGKLRVCTA